MSRAEVTSQLKFFGKENLTPEKNLKQNGLRKNIWISLMSDVSLFLSSYFWGYLETLDLLCGGINLEKLHWMQSLVQALSSGRGNPWCEQGWWWH